MDVTSETDSVHIRPRTVRNQFGQIVELGGWEAEFGQELDELAIPQPGKKGIKFTMHVGQQSPFAPVGDYQWLQLTDLKISVHGFDEAGNPAWWTRASNGLVLDIPPNAINHFYPKTLPPLSTSDSPNNDLGAPVGRENAQGRREFTEVKRNDRFKMYLMWNPMPEDGGIYVPLRVTEWSFEYDVISNDLGLTWEYKVLADGGPNPKSSGNPPSQDTTTHPAWTAKALGFDYLPGTGP